MEDFSAYLVTFSFVASAKDIKPFLTSTSAHMELTRLQLCAGYAMCIENLGIVIAALSSSVKICHK